LTEAGRVTLQYAEEIFATGRELLSVFHRPAVRGARERVLRIGAVGTLSKNLQFDFLQPLLGEQGTRLLVVAGPFEDLVGRLKEHEVDVVLSNMPARNEEGGSGHIYSHLLGEMPVYLAGSMRVPGRRAPFPRWLEGVPLFLPTRQSLVRDGFDLLLAEAGITPVIRAEVDDMALLRLLALSGDGLALVPAIVVKHELGSRRMPTRFRVPGLSERFYAITQRRRFANPLLERTIPRLREALEALGQGVRVAER
jgi:LysR family transcriptional activator of nhaA